MKTHQYMDVGQNLVPLVNIKIAGKWMFIPLKMVLIGIDPYPYLGVLFQFWQRLCCLIPVQQCPAMSNPGVPAAARWGRMAWPGKRLSRRSKADQVL